MNNSVVNTAAAASPFTWRGRPLRNPPQSTAWQRHELGSASTLPYSPNPSFSYVDLAQHWINKRFVKKPVDALPGPADGLLEAVMTYYSWETSSDVGYRVTIEHFGDMQKECPEWQIVYIRAVGDHGWMELERVAPQSPTLSPPRFKVEFFTNRPALETENPATGLTHFFETDEKPRRIYQYTLCTTHSACTLFTGLRLGDSEATTIAAPPEGSLDHWATVTDSVSYHFMINWENKLMPRTHRIEVAADFDFICQNWINWTAGKTTHTDKHLKWRGGKHEWWKDTDVEDEQKRYELFIKIQEEEHDEHGGVCEYSLKDVMGNVYMHDTTEDKWFIVVGESRSLVRHVRRELKYKEEREQAAGSSTPSEETRRWYAVEGDFDYSKNSVYIFVKTNKQRTVIDRKIVKPVNRVWHDPLNDAVGRNVLPREIFVNKYIDRMPLTVQDLFTRCEHYSLRCPGGAKTWYMYLRYEPGGSLHHLLRQHVSKLEEHKKKDKKKRDPEFREHLPEIWLWHIFERLVRACERLRREPVVKDTQLGFIHFDIKSANTLLRNRSDKNYRGIDAMRGDWVRSMNLASVRDKGFDNLASILPPSRKPPNVDNGQHDRAHPIPVLADFEFCHRLGLEWHGAGGTVGYVPPETYALGRSSPERIDIFQIGCTMYSLMRNLSQGLLALNILEQALDRPYHVPADQWVPPTPFVFDVDKTKKYWDKLSGYKKVYSNNLQTLVDHCLKEIPSHRPTIGDLLQRVQTGLLRHDKLVGGALDRRWTEVHRWHRVRGTDDQFQVGSSLGKRKKQREINNDRDLDPYSNADASSSVSLFRSKNSSDELSSGDSGSGAGDE